MAAVQRLLAERRDAARRARADAQRARFETLEPRLLYSADSPALIVQSLVGWPSGAESAATQRSTTATAVTAAGQGDTVGGSTAQRLLRVVHPTPDGSGNASASRNPGALVNSGDGLTATATPADGSLGAFTATSPLAATATPVNTAPVLTPVGPALTTLTDQDTSHPGQTVASFVGSSISDPDAGALQGIAITALTNGTGSWQYSLDGDTWNSMGTPSGGASLLLRSTDYVRFVPATQAATSGSLTYRAWDRTSGTAGSTVSTATNGGTSAFSSASDTATIAVSAANAGPTLSSSGGGTTSINFNNRSTQGMAVVQQADGKLIVAGNQFTGSYWISTVVRYNRDGSLDTTFGTAGRVTLDMSATNDGINTVALQGDGKIVIAGRSKLNGRDSFALARFNSNGSVDTSFGTNGVVITDTGQSAEITSIVIQPDGKIVAGGTNSSAPAEQFARYTSDGTLDTSFGTNGVVTVTLTAAQTRVKEIVLQPDGKIVAAGDALYNESGTRYYATLVRLNGNGSIDTSFNGGNEVKLRPGATPTGDAVALLPDGSLLLSGHYGSTADAYVARYTSAGVLDTSFGTNGVATLNIGGNTDWSYGVFVQSDGRIVIAGDTTTSGGAANFYAARFNPNGTLDTGFGASGVVQADIASGSTDNARGALLQSDGSIVVTGLIAASIDKLALARFTSAGALDAGFGGANTLSYTENGAAQVLDPQVSVSDPELNAQGHYAGATLGISRNGGANAQDLFSASGLLGALTQGGALVYNGVTVGTVTTHSGGALLLTFNSAATQSLVNGVMQSIAYSNASDAPSATVQLNWVFSDGNTGAQGSGGALTAFSSTTLNITAVNDAPVLTPANPALTAVTEDQTSPPGQTVASLLGGSVTDPDGTGLAQGLAIIAANSGNGTWQYSINGGSTWTAIGAVANTSALLLRATDQVRFVPNGQNGSTATLTYRAWDQTGGTAGSKVDASTNGGTSAFSAATDTAAITASSVNDAPVLAPVAPGLPSQTEDTPVGRTVASFIGSSISDVDTGALQGIAITGMNLGTATLQVSIDGGLTYTTVSAVSESSALLLRSTDYLRFVGDSRNATTASITYRAWDQTSGTAGAVAHVATNGGSTAFSSATDTATIAITAVNDAPQLSPTAPVLASLTEDQATSTGQTVASLIGGSITDWDQGALQGMAIIAADNGNGTWQYSTDGGSNWSAIGAVADTSALLLRSGDLVRFVPNGQNGTAASLTWRAWDQSGGSAGSKVDAGTNGATTAFSQATDTATITVTSVNDAPVLVPVSPVLSTVTEDQISNAGQTVASFLGASLGDADAGALQGIAITSWTGSGGGTWQYSLDGGATWSNIGSVSEASALLLRATDLVRSVPDGRNGGTASLTYRGWDRTTGSAGAQVDASTSGGTTAFSTATDTATMAVAAVNDAPVLAPIAPALVALTEDQTGNAGQSVASIVGASISEVDTGAVQGIAITASANGNGVWQYSIDGGASWQAVGAVADSSALVLRSTDSIRYVPNGQNGTVASITYRAWDQTSGSPGSRIDAGTNGGVTAFSITTDTATITVAGVNDAPVLTPIAPTLIPLTEDQANNAGQSVASWLAASISDLDAGAVQGIAITALVSGNGTWQYSIDGGSSWSDVGSVDDSSALLLRATDLVRFVPDGRNGTSASLTYRAWDQTSGSAGTRADASAGGSPGAFSAALDTASITVSAVNDAPVLTPANPWLNPLTSDQIANGGQTVASVLGSALSDVDSGALQGLAITAITSGNGSWQYSLDGGSTWSDVGAVTNASALLLRASDWVRFVPNGSNGTTATLSYRAWDQSSGSAGTRVDTHLGGGISAFSVATDKATVSVAGLNNAPVVTPMAPTLQPVAWDDTDSSGDTVADLVGHSITDLDVNALEGIAITAIDNGSGSWQYSLDGGASWTAIGAVSPGAALLLRAGDSVRFVPGGAAAPSSASFTYRAWDQTSGTAGTLADTRSNGDSTPFSTATDTATIQVAGPNHAPVLTPAAPRLVSINEDDAAPTGQSVASVIGGSITDADAGALQGIAIIAATAGQGSWEYSLDGGASWNAFGAVDDHNPLLLRADDWLRFVPDGRNGTTGTITYRAWDQTEGLTRAAPDAGSGGGSSAYSADTDTASITVTSVNDAPVLAPTAPRLANLTEDQTNSAGQTVASLLGSTVADVDNGAVQGIAITATVNGNGTWQFSLDGGTTWNAVGAVAGNSALLLRATDQLRFVPDGQNGSTASITYRAWDQTAGSAGSRVDVGTHGGTTAFSENTDTAAITIAAVNDAPVLTPIAPSYTTHEDDLNNPGLPVSYFTAGSLGDVDAGAAYGVAILATNDSSWFYSTDGGVSWHTVGSVSDHSALLLRSTDILRFVPDGNNGTTVTVTYRAWDQTTGTAGSKVDASVFGGTTAFSAATDTGRLLVESVNDAPVLTPAAPALATLTEDQTSPAGQTVASFLGGTVTDVDGAAVQGIAITAASTGAGLWQFSTDGGSTWNSLGAVADSSALLLRATDAIRFVPDGQNGTHAWISFRAWDQTSGSAGTRVDTALRGGTTAFSVATDTASITVASVNDAPVLTPIAPALATLTEDQTGNAGQSVASLLGGSIADADTAADQGMAIIAADSGNGRWQYSTDGGASWLAIGAVSDSSALLLRATDLVRLVPNGLDGGTASITYRAWDQTSGSAGSRADTLVHGGTTAFSSSTDTATLTVSPVNDAPVLTPVAPTLTTITEDQTGNPGQTVASFVGASLADVDSGAALGIAITATGHGNGSWQYSTDGGTTWQAVGAVAGDSALLLRATDRVRFLPDGLNGGSASITYRAWDQTFGSAGNKVDARSVGGTAAFSTATDTAAITIAAVNDAPLLTPISVVYTTHEDDVGNPGLAVSYFTGSSITDVDAGAVRGVALIGVTGGTWLYSTDGGLSWAAVGMVSDHAALLLRSTDILRFDPDGRNGTTATVTYLAWDQSTGTAGTQVDASVVGGTTAFSAATDTGSLVVVSVNDAPVLTPSAPGLAAITEDQTANRGQTVASFLASAVTDVDRSAVQGIAITAAHAGNGTWQFSIDGGSHWSDFGAVSDASALLLRATDSIRFVPDGQNGTRASFTYRAWDQSSGGAGSKVGTATPGGTSAFSTATDTASITVASVNDAPVLTPVATTLPALTEDQTGNPGQTVASILGGSITDPDTLAMPGMAITATSQGTGGWQFSTDGGATWSAIGAVSDTSALLLRGDDRIRFVPDGRNGTAGTLTFRAWDLSSGSAGSRVDTRINGDTTAFSAATGTASLTVVAVNDAPVLTPASPELTRLTEDQAMNSGQAVASWLAGAVTDADTGALQGIAITATGNGNGLWQYSTDGGATWSAIGAVSDAAALLLRGDDRVRFVPDGRNGTTGTLTYRAWDQTSGVAGSRGDTRTNGGSTAFSLSTDTARVAVSPLNDAPVLTPAAPALNSMTEDQAPGPGQTVASFTGATWGDVDIGALQGIAITASSSGNGLWQYSTDGGASWQAVGVVNDSAALLLRANDLVRLVPNAQEGGTASITYRAWDQTVGSAGSRVDARSNGGTTAFSAATDTASLTVGAVNDAPVLTPAGPALSHLDENQTANGGQTVASWLGGSVADVDGGAAQGIAIVAAGNGNGRWQYSTDGGSSWVDVGSVSSNSALLLRATDQVRFLPDGRNGTSGSLTYRAWDQTSGSAGSRADARTNGGATAFSTSTDKASVTVSAINDAPVLSPAHPALAAVTDVQAVYPGQTVGSLLGGSVTDVDREALRGIAITSTAGRGGGWQYSLDQGVTWSAMGALSDQAALLLRDSDWVRFVPDGQPGPPASFTFHAWDQTRGTAGSRVDASVRGADTAFSVRSDTAHVSVSRINHLPTGSPVIRGTPTVGQTLQADTSSLVDADGLGPMSFQWLRDGMAVPGATGVGFLLGQSDVGARLSVIVSYTDGRGFAQSLPSATTATVSDAAPAPVVPAPDLAPPAPPATGRPVEVPAPAPTPAPVPAVPTEAAPAAGPAPDARPLPPRLDDWHWIQADLPAGPAPAAPAGAETELQRDSRRRHPSADGPSAFSWLLQHHGLWQEAASSLDAVLPTPAGPAAAPSYRSAPLGPLPDWDAEELGSLEAREVMVSAALLLSLSALMWTSRISGLLGTLVVAAPAWRHFDPLPVALVRDRRPPPAAGGASSGVDGETPADAGMRPGVPAQPGGILAGPGRPSRPRLENVEERA